ncbi:MAG: FkbM family methyltransferase [Coriobacteriia bacterium]|nr:FkbM family methyltransferase [Coriobacteriia bacterium]
MSDLLNRLRRTASEGPLKGILMSAPVRSLASAVVSLRFVPAAAKVSRPLSFLFADIRHRGTAAYGLKGTDVTIVVRHDQGARELVHEVFSTGCYEPTPEQLALLPTNPDILDLGANVGGFAAYALTRWPTARITCIEPDPDNLQALEQFTSLNPSGDVRVLPVCASNSDGDVLFERGAGEGSRIGAAGVPTPAIDVFPLLVQSQFVKMDIEGAEWDILQDPRLADLSGLVLVMEYHRRFPYDQDAASAACQLLQDAGFSVGKIEPNYWGHGIMWASKPA